MCTSGPHFLARGHVCKTHTASNTAFRGFGAPQGMAFTEMIMDHVARTLQRPPHEIRELNLYKEGELTPYSQPLDSEQATACWKGVMESADFLARKAQVESFNSTSRFRKRGISIIPTKFGISFTAKMLNQGAALVNIYTDGTVLISHGGVEMGQGLHTKVAQAAAQTLGVPLEAIFIAGTSSDIVPNSSPTAGSAGSDLYGGAVYDACLQLVQRLKPYREKLPTGTFKEVVQAAWFDRTDLSAHGFYKTPDVTGWNGQKWQTRPFNYFTFGAAVSEVELDTLTGDFQLLRTDIVMDVWQVNEPSYRYWPGGGGVHARHGLGDYRGSGVGRQGPSLGSIRPPFHQGPWHLQDPNSKRHPDRLPGDSA
eukprot:jgi/Botrbrau1/673/Bobra.0161s0056.1